MKAYLNAELRICSGGCGNRREDAFSPDTLLSRVRWLNFVRGEEIKTDNCLWFDRTSLTDFIVTVHTDNQVERPLRHRFTLEIKKTHVERARLPIPINFWRSYVLTDPSDTFRAILEFEGMTYELQIVQGHGKVLMQNLDAEEFVEATKMVEGSTLCFTLVPYYSVRFETVYLDEDDREEALEFWPLADHYYSNNPEPLWETLKIIFEPLGFDPYLVKRGRDMNVTIASLTKLFATTGPKKDVWQHKEEGEEIEIVAYHVMEMQALFFLNVLSKCRQQPDMKCENGGRHVDQVEAHPDLMDDTGRRWNRQLILECFQPKEADAILQIFGMDPHRPDRLRWMWSKNGNFSIASVYAKLVNQKWSLFDKPEGSTNHTELRSARRRLWKLKVKDKLKHFIWKCINNILPVMCNLSTRNIRVDQFSPISWDGLEDHMDSFKAWWTKLCSLPHTSVSESRIQLSTYLLWWMWKTRNLWVFEQTLRPAKATVEIALSDWSEFVNVCS
ncbi:ribonuclease H-like superfamily protein [Striga asiatica]|uniref:Ribonuclease H-like superfamily protein n=1 Tax=Striga asiatica TaxID=4170 RepID=A0A5A7Q2B9_STRAF|nr:ribonuclease H-like superfamily protein [Striga asiatica]